jgi:hypothetical protein
VRDHDRAPSLLNPDSEQAGSRSCVGRDRTDGRRDLDQVAAAQLGRSGHLIAAAISAAPFRPDRERGRRRQGSLLAHASESQVRLQVVADQVGSKHTGDSRNAAKEGSRRGPSQRRTVDGVEMRAFGDEQGTGSGVSRVLLSPRRAHRLPNPPGSREWRAAGDASTPGRPDETRPGIPSGRGFPLRDDLGAECAIPCRERLAGSAHQVTASTGAAHDTKRSGGCTSCRTYDGSTMSASPSPTLRR